MGRFSTFLEHHKRVAGQERVARFNALFHWRVPEGRELEAGLEVGRFHIMTHAYWREGGPEFRDVNIMGVAHGTDRERLLEHKAAIDAPPAAARDGVGLHERVLGRAERDQAERDPARGVPGVVPGGGGWRRRRCGRSRLRYGCDRRDGS